MTEITGTDYLTGESDVPLSELQVVEKNSGDGAPPMFPDLPEGFAAFAAVFCSKYGAASESFPPIVLTDESLAVVRSYFDRTDGEINGVRESRAKESW